jgi:hypothetical protein
VRNAYTFRVYAVKHILIRHCLDFDKYDTGIIMKIFLYAILSLLSSCSVNNQLNDNVIQKNNVNDEKEVSKIDLNNKEENEDDVILKINEIKSLYEKKMYKDVELKIADLINKDSGKYA